MINFNHPTAKVLLAGLVAAALVAVTAVGTYSMMDNRINSGQGIFGSKSDESRAHFMPLDKFVISLNGDERMHYLLLELDIKTMSERAHEELHDYRPIVNNVLLKMFSQTSYEEMREMDDIEELQRKVKAHLTSTLAQNGYQHGITDVLFTKLVLQ